MRQQVVAILVGSLLVASALIFHAYERRYEGALSVGGLFVRLDSGTGKLSACTLVTRGSSLDSDAILQGKLKAAGFSDEEIRAWASGHWGQMACSPWND
jgi:hypothetical protein